MKLVTLFIAAATLTAGTAQAFDCQTGRGRAGFASGYNLEKNFLDRLWDRFGDCSDYDPFIENLDVTFITGASSQFLQCRNVGMNAALTDKADEINTTCGDECATFGEQLGELNAKIFCGVGSQYQAKTAFRIPICDQLAVQSCKIAFEGYVDQVCPELKTFDQATFQDMKESGCAIF